MKGPNDFKQELTAENLKTLEALEASNDAWFEEGHDECNYNLNVEENRTIPHRVWKEFAERADKAGWDVEFLGSSLTIKRPRR